MVFDLYDLRSRKACKELKTCKLWQSTGSIMVNVDRSFFVGSRSGGIFRDPEERIMPQFGKGVNVESKVHVKLLALREGILVVPASRWAQTHTFFLEPDSKLWLHDSWSLYRCLGDVKILAMNAWWFLGWAFSGRWSILGRREMKWLIYLQAKDVIHEL